MRIKKNLFISKIILAPFISASFIAVGTPTVNQNNKIAINNTSNLKINDIYSQNSITNQQNSITNQQNSITTQKTSSNLTVLNPIYDVLAIIAALAGVVGVGLVIANVFVSGIVLGLSLGLIGAGLGVTIWRAGSQ